MHDRLPLLIVLFFLVGKAGGAELSPADRDFFESKIRPILVDHCYECHSTTAAKEGKLKGGLQLDTREGLLAGGESGPVIDRDQIDHSLLLRALRYEDNEMPPQGQLPPSVIADFESWVQRGLPDPREGEPLKIKQGMSLEEGRRFWSQQPVLRPPPPSRHHDAWCLTAIDGFLRQQQAAVGIAPVADAAPHRQIRRLYMDLIGLPPSSAEVDHFVADPSPAAWDKLVDQLLASPQFGERWGRHWLDAARFAESNGKDRNVVWHHAWRYRDWVIDAFNRDLPYDEFLKDQIAGDLRGGDTVEERSRRLVAVGFLALGPKALAELKRDVFQMDVIDEQIDVIGRSILGLSIACARCHDHKFDPIPTADYYALAGILGSTQWLYGVGPRGIKGLHDSEWAVLGQPDAELVKAAKEHHEALKRKTQERNDARSDRYRVVRQRNDLKLQLSKPGADQTQIQAKLDEMDRVIANWDVVIKALEEETTRMEIDFPAQPDFAMSAREANTIRDFPIHIRGDTKNLGEVVPRGMLQVVATSHSRPIAANESGRLQFAEWLVDPANPLTPRVAVNRIWMHLFGRGLVSTPEDFGVNGAAPSHPELLDELAARFVADGWSTKRLIREIVSSRVYRLSSEGDAVNLERDPDNILLWRHTPRRWEAEVYRDAVLQVAGQLDTSRMIRSTVGNLPPFAAPEFNAKTSIPTEQPSHRHRAVYLSIVRGILPESLKLFDFADPSMATAQREETTVPSQASYLLNSPWMIEQAGHLADSILIHAPPDDRARLTRLYRLALGRTPTEDEWKHTAAFLTDMKASDEEAMREAWVSIAQAILAGIEFRYSL